MSPDLRGNPDMYTDLLLAIAHHLLIFALAGVIAVESMLIQQELSARSIGMLARIDRSYGLIAMLIIVIGVCRVLLGLKGWEFYVYNWAFWAKMAAFAAVGLLSIQPTLRFIAWNKALSQDGTFRVPDAEFATVRRFMRAEVVFFLLIPIFAAIMARGIGY
jgi:putative membrane protein